VKDNPFKDEFHLHILWMVNGLFETVVKDQKSYDLKIIAKAFEACAKVESKKFTLSSNQKTVEEVA